MPALADQFLQNGIKEYNAGRYTEALGCFGAAKGTDSNNPILHYYLANCFIHINQKTDAIKEYQLTLALNPDSNLANHCHTALQRLGIETPKNAPINSSVADAATFSQLAQVVLVTKENDISKQLEPLFKELEEHYKSYSNFSKIKVEKASDTAKSLIKRYHVTTYPTILLFDRNGNLINCISKVLSDLDFRYEIVQLIQANERLHTHIESKGKLTEAELKKFDLSIQKKLNDYVDNQKKQMKALEDEQKKIATASFQNEPDASIRAELYRDKLYKIRRASKEEQHKMEIEKQKFWAILREDRLQFIDAHK
jgi:tetratricopeptide (TPR) repeat protein